jgi:CarD family transcriptional regulator
MFEIGDKIFYPMHGAGIVKAIEEKEVLGEKQVYYILTMSLRKLQVMIPMGKSANSFIREVMDPDILEDVLDIFHQDKPGPTVNPYQQRQRVNMDKMRSGDVYEGAQVIRDLLSLSKNKKLGMEDKLMLDNARLMLISELVLVKGLGEEQAAKLLN